METNLNKSFGSNPERKKIVLIKFEWSKNSAGKMHFAGRFPLRQVSRDGEPGPATEKAFRFMEQEWLTFFR